MTKTHMGRVLQVADDRLEYDEHAKNLLSDKLVLAWLISSAVEEVKGMAIGEIIGCIEDDIAVSQVLINPGETNKPEKIAGDNTQDLVPYEGEVKYDIRFHIRIPGTKKKCLKLLLNIEMQKVFHKPYDLVTRGIFYGCRMISAQKDTEFTGSNYQEIKKVYSIWICMDAPNYIGNAMTEYSMKKRDLVGTTPDKPGNYDKITILMIYLNRKSDKKEKTIFHFLNTLFAPDINVDEKEIILKEDFGINITLSERVKKELRKLCNLGEALVWETEMRVTERVTEQVTERVTETGAKVLIETCREFNLSKTDTQRRVEEKFHLPAKKAESYMEKYWK